jgi:aminopeptidase N
MRRSACPLRTTRATATGALFFATLRDEIGPDAFSKLLRTYLERYQWRIATPADFQALAEEVSGKDLDAMFAEWVGE